MTNAERILFDQLATTNPHLTLIDTPLLAAYCQAITRTLRLGRSKDIGAIGAWERTARLAMSLATKLRISPQACANPQTLARARRDQDAYAKPWAETADQGPAAEVWKLNDDADGNDDDA